MADKNNRADRFVWNKGDIELVSDAKEEKNEELTEEKIKKVAQKVLGDK